MSVNHSHTSRFITELHSPDPSQEDVEEDGRPAHAADKPKSNNNDGEGDNPEDILSEEDLVRNGIAAVEMRRDDRPGESRGHGEIGDGADEKSDGEEVVEDLLAMA